MPEAPIDIQRATPSDFGEVVSLLETAELPTAGVREHLTDFWVARVGQTPVGCIGLESYGDVALLRSLVVDAKARTRGLGGRLVAFLLEYARSQQVRELYLLTTTAEDYFPRFGFEHIDRLSADERVQRSEEFRGACPDSAVCMRYRLER